MIAFLWFLGEKSNILDTEKMEKVKTHKKSNNNKSNPQSSE